VFEAFLTGFKVVVTSYSSFYLRMPIILKMKISDLKDKTAVDEIELKITDVKEPTETRVGTVQQATVEDDTGSATLTLWNEQAGAYDVGDVVKITKGWCKEYQGQLQVSTGKFGAIEKLE